MSNKISKSKCPITNYLLLDLLTIEEKIKFSSLASCQCFLASFFNSGVALATILNQCLVSFDSFLQIPNEMVAKLFLLQFYLFGCVIVRLRKMLFAVAGLRPQNILLIFLASLENLKFRYEIVLQSSQFMII